MQESKNLTLRVLSQYDKNQEIVALKYYLSSSSVSGLLKPCWMKIGMVKATWLIYYDSDDIRTRISVFRAPLPQLPL